MAKFEIKETLKPLFTKKNVLTWPNLITSVRFVMIPLIIYFNSQENYNMVAVVTAISCLSDVLDGIVARKTGSVSDMGKVLDPIADKLTQGVLLLCLASRYPGAWWLIGLFLFKELAQLVIGFFTVTGTGEVTSARWYGKACTVFLFVVIFILILVPAIPQAWAEGLLIACGVALLTSLALYARFFLKALFKALGEKKQDSGEKTE